ncbi:MAG: sulfotransferase domain-containing protein [Pseudomonadota bacterium]|uniref:sulfotransferase domain-containing protein n=1 Tax=Roseovarius sp. TaxID=1486281 RepID=UPI003564AE58
MMISHSRKFVFVKTKKTAGTSIECALAPYLEPGDLTSPLVEHAPGTRRYSKEFVRILRERDASLRARNPHLPYSVVADHFARETKGYYRFCVERNPWDKAISAFFFWISRHGHDSSKTEEENFLAFAESERLGFFSDYDLYMRKDKPQVDRVLRYENLAEEFAQVTDKLGLPEISIGSVRAKGDIRPKASRKLQRFYGADLENGAAKRVQSVFAREIAYFGFTPEPA